MFIDTHCHLDDEKFTQVESEVNAYLDAGVDTVINMGCDVESSIRSKNLSARFESVYFAAGIHPSEIDKIDDNTFNKISSLLSDKKCVAVGEIGLDYHYGTLDKDKQIEVFNRQIEIAYQYKLPISIHMRDATKDGVSVLKSNADRLIYGGVMHCFSGSVETAKILLDLGLYISFGGTLTFKNASNLIDVCKYVPTDRCLTETDSPYLAPHPYRGQINSPKNVPIICARIAEIKNTEITELAGIIKNNAKTVFKKI